MYMPREPRVWTTCYCYAYYRNLHEFMLEDSFSLSISLLDLLVPFGPSPSLSLCLSRSRGFPRLANVLISLHTHIYTHTHTHTLLLLLSTSDFKRAEGQTIVCRRTCVPRCFFEYTRRRNFVVHSQDVRRTHTHWFINAEPTFIVI